MNARLAIRTAAATAAVAGSILFPTAAHADVAPGGTTGAVQLVGTPSSLAAGAFTSDTVIRVMNEGSITLTANLFVVGMGTNGWTTVNTLTASTCVQSHLVHMNRTSSTAGALSGSVTFNSNVLGVATDLTFPGLPTGILTATDTIFGNPGTTYATGATGRGLELLPVVDRVTLPSAKTVNLTLTAGPDMDELRIITLCDGPPPIVPEAPYAVLLPASAALIGGFVLLRRRQLASA
jgi:hypothetical protein